MGYEGRQIRSTVRAGKGEEGELELSLATVEAPDPGPDDVVVRVEASPINPSDLGLLFGPADMARAKAGGTPEDPIVTAPIPAGLMRMVAARLDQSLPVGNEGAGVVVAAGESEGAQALLGKTVGLIGGAMYSEYRTLTARQCLPLPEGTPAAAGASCFVNPLTALGMVETMRMEGHKALVHTAAASNLGQMLVRLCGQDGIDLVNIYLPAGASSPEAQKRKDAWIARFKPWAETLRRRRRPVLLAGDFNIARSERDIFHWKSNRRTSGFLPHERTWMNDLVDSGWSDVVREEAGDVDGPYTWWSNRGQARVLDRGWRIDYVLLNRAARKRLRSVHVDREAALEVSDHGPVLVELE